jgi:hypothetical protein
VLKASSLRDVDGNGESYSAADAIAKPNRPDAGVLDGEPLGREERA